MSGENSILYVMPVAEVAKHLIEKTLIQKNYKEIRPFNSFILLITLSLPFLSQVF